MLLLLLLLLSTLKQSPRKSSKIKRVSQSHTKATLIKNNIILYKERHMLCVIGPVFLQRNNILKIKL